MSKGLVTMHYVDVLILDTGVYTGVCVCAGKGIVLVINGLCAPKWM